MRLRRKWGYILMVLLSVHISTQDDSSKKKELKAYKKLFDDKLTDFFDNKMIVFLEDKLSKIVQEKLEEKFIERFDKLEKYKEKASAVCYNRGERTAITTNEEYICPSDQGFISFEKNQCFKLFNNEMSWSDAKTFCETQNLRLAEPLDSTAVMLRNYVLNNDDNDHFSIWMGAQYIRSHLRWESNGQQVNPDLWYPGTFADSSKCLTLLVSNHYKGIHPENPYDPNHCTSTFRPLCQTTLKPATPEPCSGFQCENGKCIASSRKCDSVDNCGDNSDESSCQNICPSDQGFISFEKNQCFMLFNNEMSWSDAKTFCETQNLRLAEPLDSTAVQLRNYVLNNEDDDHFSIWMGAQYSRSHLRWESNGQQVNPDLWYPGTFADSSKCLTLLVSNHYKGIHPGHPYDPNHCTSTFRPLCQMTTDLSRYNGPLDKVWNTDQCDMIEEYSDKSLTECKGMCDTETSCTAINYSESYKSCVLRECTLPVPQPQWELNDYAGYSKVSGDCPEDEGYFLSPDGNQCFKIVRELRNWTAADSFCKSEGMTLAEPTNSNTAWLQNYVHEQYGGRFSETEPPLYWVGLRGSNSYVYKWQRSGEEMRDDSSLWLPGDPTLGGSTLQCVAMNLYSPIFTANPGRPYRDYACDNPNVFQICERSLV